MSVLREAPKRLFLGRPMRSSQLSETLLPKKLAMPVFCSDPLSSVAYATEEILLILSLGGLALSAPRLVRRSGHRRSSRGRDRVLSANLPGVPERRRRLHRRPRQPRAVGRAGGSQRAAGRLRAHCRRIRRCWSCSDHVGHSRTVPARRLPIGGFCGAAHSHEPARRQRVREGVRRPRLTASWSGSTSCSPSPPTACCSASNCWHRPPGYRSMPSTPTWALPSSCWRCGPSPPAAPR